MLSVIFSNKISLADWIGLISVAGTILGLSMRYISKWLKDVKLDAGFRQQTITRLAEIEDKILSIEESREKDIKKIEEKLDMYQKDNSNSHNQLFENINRNQRDFYNQITNILTAKK